MTHDDRSAASKPPLRALIVEDNPRDAELAVAALRQAGYVVCVDVVDTPERLLEDLEEDRYDVILSDHNLRDWSGLDALKIVRDCGKDVPFIVLTGSLGDEAAVDYIKRGATDYVLKDRLARLPLLVGRALEEMALREEHLRTEEARRASEERLSLIARVIHDVVWDWNLLTDEVWWSDGLEASFGYRKEEVAPSFQWRHARVHPEDAERVLREILGVVQSGEKTWTGEYRFRKGDGSYAHILERLRVISDATGRPVKMLGSMVDITERKRLEDQFRQAQKMEAVGQLAGGVAHDFNNFLTIITGYSELLLERLGPEDGQRANLEQIKRAGERAAALTRQLLAFSRRQVLVPQDLDLNAIVADIDKMLRRLIGEHIELVTIRQEGLGKVRSDPGQIEQVIMNLAVNARDAMPQGGKLTIETANVQLDEEYARRHALVTPGRHVLLAVSDTGCGMDAATQAHVFEPFFTTKGEGRGTGLGLATVYGIVKQSGGHICVYSEVGKGTSVKLYLPHVGQDVRVVEPKKEAEIPRGSETILLVEDEAALRMLVRELLESKGYRVIEARHGPDALFVCEQHKGPIHLLLTDVVMPEMNGRELAERLAPFHREMKVLYMSGYTDDAIVHHGVLDAGMGFLQKPFSRNTLARKVREVLGEATPHPGK